MAQAQGTPNKKVGCWVGAILLFGIVGGCSALVDGGDSGGNAHKAALPIAASSSASDDVTLVADYTGEDLKAAENAAQTAGITNVTSQDLSSDDRMVIISGNWQVCSQDPPSGATMSAGEVLTLNVLKDDEDCDDPDGVLSDTSSSTSSSGGSSDDSSSTGSSDDSSSSSGGSSSGDNGSSSSSSSGGSSSSSGGSSSSSSSGSSGNSAPGGATAKCVDGTYSYSAHHQGTCSHHHGVAVWLD